MSKFLLALSAAVVIAFGIAPRQVMAQPPGRGELNEDIQDLTRLDPDIERYLPRWRVLEADLKIKLAQIFKLSGAQVSETDSMIVTASFPKPGTGEQQILTIRVGDSPKGTFSGTQKIRGELGERLYQEILAGNYARSIIEPATPITNGAPQRIPNVLEPTTAKQFIAISAFSQTVQIGMTGAKLEHQLGNDEIGYPFWASGQGKALLSYPIIRLDNSELRAKGVPDILTARLGVGYRLKIGSDSGLNQIIVPRKLNGSLDAKAITRIEYRLPQVNDLGFAVYAEIPFTKLTNTQLVDAGPQIASMTELMSGKRTVDTIRGAYFLRTVAQGMVFWETWLNEYEHFFRISLGASYQEISHAQVMLAGKPVNPNRGEFQGDAIQLVSTNALIHPTVFEDWIYAKVDYLNQSGFPFGVSAQLSNQNLLVSGFIPLIPNWLFIQAKYSTPILRDRPEAWENKSFFMISPILRFMIE